LEACATFAHRLLQAGSQIGIIVTSRERLNVAGEQTYEVASLPIPGVDQEGVEALLRFEAVRLFVDRASAAQSGFRLSQNNAHAVATICRTLEGIPLAIELVAPRVRALSVMEIGAQLANRFRLLTGGIRNTARHHQTMYASIDWSHDLLTSSERALFRRLSVFAGGWTLEAAEVVAPDGELAGHDVLNRIADLIDKSLVILDASSGRYRMLETVRQYALEQLAEAGESDTTRSRHLGYYVTMLEGTYDKAYGSEQSDWFARLHAERRMKTVLKRRPPAILEQVGPKPRLPYQAVLDPTGLLGLGYRVTREAVGRVGASRVPRGGRVSALGDLSFVGAIPSSATSGGEPCDRPRIEEQGFGDGRPEYPCMALWMVDARARDTRPDWSVRDLGDETEDAAILVSFSSTAPSALVSPNHNMPGAALVATGIIAWPSCS
jgi:hypothetical protein